MGGLVIATVAPGMLVGLLSGGLVDRYNRVYLLATSLGLRGLASVLFLLPISTDIWLPVIYLVNFLLAILVQFELTTEAALLPDLVDKNQLLAANGIFGLNALAAQGIGFLIISPTLLRIGGLRPMGGVACLGFFIALLLLATLLRNQKTTVHYWHDRLEPGVTVEYPARSQGLIKSLTNSCAGWSFVSTDRPTRKAVIHLATIYTLLMIMITLLPGFLTRVVGRSMIDLTILALPVGVGFGLGTWLIGLYGYRFNAGSLGNIGLVLAGLTLASMANWRVESGLPVLILIVLFMGLSLALVIIPARTVLQSQPPSELRGRVWAIQVVLNNAAALLPILFSGSLADRIGIQPVFLLTASTVLVIGLSDVPAMLKDGFPKGAR
jgi:MFS family permease